VGHFQQNSVKNNTIAIFETKKGKLSENIIEVITQQQKAIYYKSLRGNPMVEAFLTLSFLYQK